MGKSIKFPKTERPEEIKPAVPNSIEYPKRITIDTAKGIRTSDNVTFTDVVNLCLNAMVSNAIKVVMLTMEDHERNLQNDGKEITPETLDAMRHGVTEHLYDHMNMAFTDALHIFAPEIQAHPGLTELAIQKAEDELITDYLNNLPPDELAGAVEKVNTMLKDSRRKLLQDIETRKTLERKIDESFIPLTPEQDAAIKVLADEDATEEALIEAREYLDANPVSDTVSMSPAEMARREEIPTFETVAKPMPEVTNPNGQSGPLDPISDIEEEE